MSASDSVTDPAYAAASVLFRARHQLPPDLLRTLADIWTCGSAAGYGEPHERFWELNDDADFYVAHDVEMCETSPPAERDDEPDAPQARFVPTDDIPLHHIEGSVCDLCLSGAGGECHVPGCSFWMHDAPTGDTLVWLTMVRETTALIDTDRAAGGAS